MTLALDENRAEFARMIPPDGAICEPMVFKD